MTENINNSLLGVKEPYEKLKSLAEVGGNSVKVDLNVPLMR